MVNIRSGTIHFVVICNSVLQHIEKQLTLPRKNIVDRKLKKITLKDEAVQVAVSKAEENSEIIEWKGYPLKIVSQWQISSESTGDSLMVNLFIAITLIGKWFICVTLYIATPRRN